ncbi:hypothetical protein EPA93_27115 [Ktedonosporobacter rubrisoli]|uniref:DUF4347 domain-containing protein n=1 Tax=Ktedonosporobacter rubrisoli TaxID=2509675 RepID=A0A4P6JVA8_KTERU|nr:hypothetical protein [Ktedonosporobacter rubrisoli]QBD79454.1 hypothetical protein EPA93_27115 [Ktedonosporobacter rubrisoli]
MYDIITTTPDDKVVMAAINVIVGGGSGVIPAPAGNYVLTVPGSEPHKAGDGGATQSILVIVGHGSATALSKSKDWSTYKSEFSGASISWSKKTSVYIVACKTASPTKEESYFFYQNFAKTVKKDFPEATVWASESNVGSKSLSGDWTKVE